MLSPRTGPRPRHVHPIDARAARALVCPGDQRVDGRALAPRLGLARAVLAVLDPAGHAESSRLLLHRAAIPDALHASAHHDPCDRHPRTSARNASSSRRATPSFSARFTFDPGSTPTT